MTTTTTTTTHEAVSWEIRNREHIELRGVEKVFNPAGWTDKILAYLLPCCSSIASALSFSEGSQPVHALKGLSMRIYSGEIVALLGHNGAGKSTTIGILTGLFAPTKGSLLWVGGRDLMVHMDDFRRVMGVCPQTDILFDELTVREHLEFYAMLKGVPSGGVDNEVKTKLSELDLNERRDAQAKTLSGGQKRRLSIAIALIGGSRVIFLDEPTAGVDPLSRHQVWSLLQRYKQQQRMMILTTHHMDEADLLGDRIAILASGRLKCYGSSLFLKNRFGSGYRLDMVKSHPTVPTSSITSVVRRLIPGATMPSAAAMQAQQVSMVLPYGEVAAFSRLFKVLEETESDIGVSHFGISLATLEEVFFKIAQEHQEEE
eukprot:jgi/Bigna1/33997/e_gw1.4.41.1